MRNRTYSRWIDPVKGFVRNIPFQNVRFEQHFSIQNLTQILPVPLRQPSIVYLCITLISDSVIYRKTIHRIARNISESKLGCYIDSNNRWPSGSVQCEEWVETQLQSLGTTTNDCDKFLMGDVKYKHNCGCRKSLPAIAFFTGIAASDETPQFCFCSI